MLALRRKNRKGTSVPVAEKGEQGGLFVDWPQILTIMLPHCSVIAGSGVTAGAAIANEMVYGFIANIQKDAAGHINHAVAVVRMEDKEFYLFDSLTCGPLKLTDHTMGRLCGANIWAIVSNC